jgi:hypothetical protein
MILVLSLAISRWIENPSTAVYLFVLPFVFLLRLVLVVSQNIGIVSPIYEVKSLTATANILPIGTGNYIPWQHCCPVVNLTYPELPGLDL